MQVPLYLTFLSLKSHLVVAAAAMLNYVFFVSCFFFPLCFWIHAVAFTCYVFPLSCLAHESLTHFSGLGSDITFLGNFPTVPKLTVFSFCLHQTFFIQSLGPCCILLTCVSSLLGCDTNFNVLST